MKTNDLKKAFMEFEGKIHTLYCSGSEQRVNDYIQQWGIPEKFITKIVIVDGEHRLYMHIK